MIKKIYISIIFILFFAFSKGAEQTCTCTMNLDDFGSVSSTVEAGTLFSISPDNQIENKKDIGKLFSIKGVLFTQNNYDVKMSTRDLSLVDNATCPAGYRKMTVEDAQIIVDNVKDDDYASLLDATKMNFPAGEVFFTVEREFPDVTDGSNFDAYKYKAFKTKEGDTAVTMSVHSTAMSGTTKKTKCVLSSSLSTDDVELEEDLIKGVAYTKDFTKTNVIDYEVEVTGGEKHTGASVTFTPTTTGCFEMKIKWKFFDGTILAKCDARFVKSYMGSDSDTSFSKADITEVVYDGISSNRITGLHFSAATAPMAAKEDGGAYILFKEKDTNKLKIQEVDNDMAAVKVIDLSTTATPLAIATSTEVGIAVYAQDADDTNYSWLAVFGHDGTLKWKKTIMKNGKDPNSAPDQLTFTNTDGSLPYGMKCMHKPHNGELQIGRGRIFLVFAHYNNFKCGESSRDDHTGDTMISCNFSGENFMLGSNWSASHSLTQRAVYDGKFFITSTLGDAFPQQIKFTSQNGKYNNGYKDGANNELNRFANYGNATLIPGEIPGDGTGQACGRLGGLSIINASGLIKFAQVYARKPCTSGYSGTTKTNDVDEIGIVFFDRSLTLISHKTLTTGADVNVVTSAKYGKNIVVLFSRTSRQGRSDGLFAPDNYNTDSTDDKTYMMLVSDTGEVVSQPVQLDSNIINNDNMIVLANGNVVWSFVDTENKLKTFRLKTPTASDPLGHSEVYGENSVVTPPSTENPGAGIQIDSIFCLLVSLLALFMLR